MKLFSESYRIIRNEGLMSFLSRFRSFVERNIQKNTMIDSMFLRLSVWRLKKWKEDERGIEDVINTAKNFRGLGLYKSLDVSQVNYEYKLVLDEINRLDPDIVMEIGTKEGGTLYGWTRVGRPDKVVSVDLPEGAFGGGYPRQKGKFYRKFDVDVDMALIRGNSHSRDILAEVEDRLADEKVDFLFIDGDHTYEGVKQDFGMYKHLVKSGGLIAFHDILEHPDMENCNVDKFWNEIKDEYETKEIYEEKDVSGVFSFSISTSI